MLERHLKAGGYLFIAHSESLNGIAHGLEPCSRRCSASGPERTRPRRSHHDSGADHGTGADGAQHPDRGRLRDDADDDQARRRRSPAPPIGTIFEAANGREALAILEQHPVQFVFTDLNMPS